jgi:hypothetical protein
MKRFPPNCGDGVLQSVMEGFPAVYGIGRNDPKALRNSEGINIHGESTFA